MSDLHRHASGAPSKSLASSSALPPDSRAGIALPPAARSHVGLGLTAAAALGRFELQVCRDCAAVQYPPREACRRCLSVRLDWKRQAGEGALIAETTLFHSHNDYFRERLPWRLGMVRLDCGVSVLANLHQAVSAVGARVRVDARLDRAGLGVLIAFPAAEVCNMSDDEHLREMTCDPRGRKVLVTDANSPVGQALVSALLAAGAQCVRAGEAEATSVDILINTTNYRAAAGDAAGARAEMDANYFGLLRLAHEFGPALRARRSARGTSSFAWVNVLSVYALAGTAAQGTYSASMAAAHAFAQSQRAELQGSGIRVINVFPSPAHDVEATANAIVAALQSGIEDVYPDDIAQEWYARWRENPKVLERELAALR